MIRKRKGRALQNSTAWNLGVPGPWKKGGRGEEGRRGGGEEGRRRGGVTGILEGPDEGCIRAEFLVFGPVFDLVGSKVGKGDGGEALVRGT
jgi:hypothetical protein